MGRSSYTALIFIWLTGMLLVAGCDSRPGDQQKQEKTHQPEADGVEIEKSRAILSSKTLGLAYLEDNELEKNRRSI